MTKEQKQELKSIIQIQILTLTDEITTIQKLLQPIKKDCALDNVAHQSLKQDQNINIQRYEVSKIRLGKLKAAYLRVDTNEYGVCKECEEDINIARLKLIPESQYCISCMNELGL
ncbi:TraR/DksA family transcriptional regulator [Sulfurimonas sp.]